mmetsp:Transcript_38453/g.105934  ORF Transcript_38453/g.105934 Transcript_38453/m.105934 type:complete len:361 (+) Transcript_38453:70-1152(+)
MATCAGLDVDLALTQGSPKPACLCEVANSDEPQYIPLRAPFYTDSLAISSSDTTSCPQSRSPSEMDQLSQGGASLAGDTCSLQCERQSGETARLGYPSPNFSPYQRPVKWLADYPSPSFSPWTMSTAKTIAEDETLDLLPPPMWTPVDDDCSHWNGGMDARFSPSLHVGQPHTQLLDPMFLPGQDAGEAYVPLQGCDEFQQAAWYGHAWSGLVEQGETCFTTLMLRNLPKELNREMLLELLDTEGFDGAYDFVYVPVSFNTGACMGYALVNLVTPVDARRVSRNFEGFSSWPVDSDNVCTVSWSEPYQGYAQHVERYRNSPVMHDAVPDEWKPAVFVEGVRVPFPPPSTTIKAPKVRRSA